MPSSRTKAVVGKHTPQEIAEILESDDEFPDFPDSYVETSYIPAYLDDNRFEKRQEDLFYGKRKSENDPHAALLEKQTTEEQSYVEHPNEETSTESTNYSITSEPSHKLPHIIGTTSNKKILITKGFMTKRDIFLIKSIEECSTDTTLIWFINFLSSKAVKPIQRGCLVEDMFSASFVEPAQSLVDFNMRYYLVVTN